MLLCERQAESLRQVRMPPGPMQHSLQQAPSELRPIGESVTQRCSLAFREIGQLYAATNVKGSRPGVPNQVGRRCHSEQAKAESVQVRIVSAAIVQFTNAGEEFIGAEWQAADSIDLIHKDHDLAWAAWQYNFGDRIHPALHGSQVLVLLPEFLQLILELKLLADSLQQAVVPLVGGQVLPESSQVEDGNGEAFLAQTCSRPNHQRRFAHLPGREDITDFTPVQCRIKQFIGLTGNVAGSVAPERASGDEE